MTGRGMVVVGSSAGEPDFRPEVGAQGSDFVEEAGLSGPELP